MQEEIAVSIICNAYNHEQYIRDALESFVMQKTNFKFEILVHDDASTDKTADIIREYEKKYPGLIKPIYQTENQYSQGISIGIRYQFPRAKGKYIAICEGDDYWIDENKLQKQFDALECNPDIDVCAHAAIVVDAQTKTVIKHIRPLNNSGRIATEKVIAGGGGFVATNSLFYRAAMNENVPKFREYLSLDYTLQIHTSLRGGMLYLKDCMSAYRHMSNGSWTARMNIDEAKRAAHEQKIFRMLEILNQDTEYKYSKIIDEKILRNKSEAVYRKVLRNQDLDASDYDIIRNTNLKWKIKILMCRKLPKVADKLKEIKRLIRK